VNKKTIIISAMLSALAALNPTVSIGEEMPDELFYDIDETAQVILTPDLCRYEPELFGGRILNKITQANLYVCWYTQNGVAHIQGFDEDKNVYDYSYFLHRFQPRWF
jgi:hypothetical protein